MRSNRYSYYYNPLQSNFVSRISVVDDRCLTTNCNPSYRGGTYRKNILEVVTYDHYIVFEMMVPCRIAFRVVISNSLIHRKRTAAMSVVAPVVCHGRMGERRGLTTTTNTTADNDNDNSSTRRMRAPPPRRQQQQQQQQQRHDKMMEKILYIKSVLPRGGMDTKTFQYCLTVIETYTKAEVVCPVELQTAQDLLHRLYEETKADRTHQLSARPYIQIMRGWARNRLPDALEHCRNLFECMEARYQQQQHQQPNPYQPHVYAALLYTCGQSNHPDARAIGDMFMSAFEARAANNDGVKGTNSNTDNKYLPVELYNQMILLHASRAAEEYGAAAAAEDWLVHVSHLHTQGGPAPTAESFNRVLRAWSLSPETFAVQRAQTILNLMLQLEKDHPDVKPNPDTFATMLLGCGRHGQPNQAEELWQETVNYFERQHDREVDLSQCLNATTLAWSKSEAPEAADRIDGLLQQCFLRGPSNVTMDFVGESITNLLVALVQRGDLVQADERLRKFWQSHISLDGPTPPPVALHFIIKSYKYSDHPHRAELAAKLLLDAVELSQKYRSLPVPETTTFNLCIDLCLLQTGAKSLAVDILEAAESMQRANVFTYNLVINALCKEKNEVSAFEALRILEKLRKADADSRCPVQLNDKNIGLYTAVLGALSSVPSPEAANSCLDLFQSIKSSPQWNPSTRMYTSVIFSMRMKGKTGRHQAFVIFQEMLQADKDPSNRIALDVFAFQTVLKVLNCKKGDAAAAKSSLEVLLTMFCLNDSGRKELRPNQICMDACFSAVANSRDPTLLRQALQLIKEIHRRFDVGTLPELPSEDVVERLNKGKS